MFDVRESVGLNDTLVNVERAEFADVSVALDLDGAAGMTAKILGAVFGRQHVHNREFVGIGLSLFDSGLAYAGYALSAKQKAAAV